MLRKFCRLPSDTNSAKMIPMNLKQVIQLLTLAGIWGGAFIFVKVVAPVLGPILTSCLRLSIGGAVLCLFYFLTKFNVELKRHWRVYLILGAMNLAIPITLFSFSALHLPASFLSVLNATAPMFGAVFSALWLKDPLKLKRFLGLVLGGLGVFFITKHGHLVRDSEFWPSTLACLTAAGCYGWSGVYTKKHAKEVNPKGIAGVTQLIAGLLLLLALPMNPSIGAVSPKIVMNLLGVALLCSALAYVIFYNLIAAIGPTRALTVTFLMPIFGILWGVLFLGEVIHLPMLLGAGLIIIGTVFVVRN